MRKTRKIEDTIVVSKRRSTSNRKQAVININPESPAFEPSDSVGRTVTDERLGITPDEKRCRICLEVLPIAQFYRNRRMKDGHWAECKACCVKLAIKRNRERYQGDPATREKVLKYQREKYATDPAYRASKLTPNAMTRSESARIAGREGGKRPKPKRFTDDEASDIARRYVAGESGPQIAADLGCDPGTIYDVLERIGVKRRTR